MFSVLVTRPEAVSQRLRERLGAAGFEVTHAPLLEILPMATPRPYLAVAPLVVLTSRATLACLEARRSEIADLLALPCFCVGPATAERARSFGFKQVVSADGDGAALARLILEQRTASARPILHIGGADVSLEPDHSLSKAGLNVVPWTVYKAQALAAFPADLSARLVARGFDAALFYSARSASHFVQLLQRQKLEPCCESLIAVGLSPAVIQALAPLSFDRTLCAASPSEEALLAQLFSCQRGSP